MVEYEVVALNTADRYCQSEEEKLVLVQLVEHEATNLKTTDQNC